MNRVNFLVDGFNLYHSTKKAQSHLNGSSTKWLNIKSLCGSYLHIIRRIVGDKTELNKVYYISALATHIEQNNPGVTTRHKRFIKCLKDTGVDVNLNRFKKKGIKCRYCYKTFFKHEEKETDVALAVKLIEIFVTDECDTAVLITGDTDLAPAVRAVNKLFPEKNVLFAFPYRRRNDELKALAPNSFEINKKHYSKHQFTDPYILSDGTIINKPGSW